MKVVTHFNSIKVRLERVGAQGCFRLAPFQFHKGTIRTSLARMAESSCHHFNSIKVRLERTHQATEKERKAISIP